MANNETPRDRNPPGGNLPNRIPPIPPNSLPPTRPAVPQGQMTLLEQFQAEQRDRESGNNRNARTNAPNPAINPQGQPPGASGPESEDGLVFELFPRATAILAMRDTVHDYIRYLSEYHALYRSWTPQFWRNSLVMRQAVRSCNDPLAKEQFILCQRAYMKIWNTLFNQEQYYNRVINHYREVVQRCHEVAMTEFDLGLDHANAVHLADQGFIRMADARDIPNFPGSPGSHDHQASETASQNSGNAAVTHATEFPHSHTESPNDSQRRPPDRPIRNVNEAYIGPPLGSIAGVSIPEPTNATNGHL